MEQAAWEGRKPFQELVNPGTRQGGTGGMREEVGPEPLNPAAGL